MLQTTCAIALDDPIVYQTLNPKPHSRNPQLANASELPDRRSSRLNVLSIYIYIGFRVAHSEQMLEQMAEGTNPQGFAASACPVVLRFLEA